MKLTYGDRFNDMGQMADYANNTANDLEIHTRNVMREETEMLLNKQKTIFNILTVVTIVSVLITVKYSQN